MSQLFLAESSSTGDFCHFRICFCFFECLNLLVLKNILPFMFPDDWQQGRSSGEERRNKGY